MAVRTTRPSAASSRRRQCARCEIVHARFDASTFSIRCMKSLMPGHCSRRIRSRGFTLIEVMIVVVVVAILAAIALPSYADYVRRGQVVEAFTVLSDYKVKMEQYYQDNRNYGNAGGAVCANAAGAPTWANFTSHGAKYFTFACALASSSDNQSYTITATGSAGRAVSHTYTMNSAGERRTAELKGTGYSPAKPCWAVKEGDC
jgi:type IV pilus assembly protein PilE